MTRTRRPRRGVVALTAAVTLPAGLAAPSSLARETYLASDSTHVWGEIQGATAPIAHPGLLLQTNLPNIPHAKAIASDGTSAYVLAPEGNTGPAQALYTFDLATGSLTNTTHIPFAFPDNGLQDLAAVGGSVYGTWTGFPGDVRIRRINSDGSLTDVFSTTTASHAFQVRIAASAQADTVVLIPGGVDPRDPTQHILINPNTWTATQTVNADGGPGIAAVLNLDGTRLTESADAFSIFGGAQTTRAVPGFASLGERPFGQNLGRSYIDIPGGGPPTALSDAVDIAYPVSLPAVVETDPLYYHEGDPETRVLVRRPGDSFTLPLRITNYATPDGTTVDQVVVTHVTWTQHKGGTPIQATVAPDPAGDLSTRRIAQATFTLPVGVTPQYGLYTLIPDVALQGRYTAGDQQSTRTLQAVNPTQYRFAVDPVSDNLIGNGNFNLGEYGWSGGVATTTLWLPSNVPSQRTAGQYLELGIPDSPLMLSFDYSASANSSSDLFVRINGITVVTLSGVTQTTFQHFSIELDDPRLRNLSNPLFEFEAISTTGGNPYVYIDNASLIAVPEPSVGALVFALLPLTPLRRRRGHRARSPIGRAGCSRNRW